MRQLPFHASLCFALLSGALPALAGDSWTQFRGPGQQSWSDAHGLPITWSETEHIKWKTDLPGAGWSSPVVDDGKIWLTTALDDGHSLHALCLDLATGKVLIDTEVLHVEAPPPKHERNSYASPTPTIAGGRVYVNFGVMGTAALDAATGRKLWENFDLKVDVQNAAGGSPKLYKDKLLIACDGMDEQYGAALDASTGKLLWKVQRSAIPKLQSKPPDMRKAYGSPALISIDGHEESVVAGAERLYGEDPETGAELWHLDIPGFSNVGMPAWDGKILTFSTGFSKPELWGIRMGDCKGDITPTHILWKSKAAAPNQSSPLLVNGRVYTVNDSGIASCLNAESGSEIWKHRLATDFAASPLYADGRIYFFDAKGACNVVAPEDTYHELAENKLDAGCMASPAVVGKALIVRTKTSLYRIEE